MRWAVSVITLFFISSFVFANEAENDLQLTVTKVWDTRTTAEWPELKILTTVKTGFLKDAKRKRIQIIRAEDNLGNDLISKEFNKSNEDFSIIDRKDDTTALIGIDLKLPPSKATHIKKIEGTLELYIPGLDSRAKAVFSNFSEKLKSGSYFEANIFASRSLASLQSQKDEISLRATYGFSSATGDIINVQVVDKNKKVIDFILIDKKGNEIMPDGVSRSEDKTDLRYRFPVHPTEIADLVIYLRTYKVIKLIPLEYNNIPLPQ